MTLKTLCTWGIAVIFLAGCSGGGSSTPGAVTPLTPSSSGPTGTLSINATLPSTQSTSRNPLFVGSQPNNLQYTLYDTSSSAAVAFSGNATPTCTNGSCTFTISAIPVGSYGGVLLTLDATSGTGTPMANGFATNTSASASDSFAPVGQTGSTLHSTLAAKYNFSVTAGATTALNDVFAPVNSTPFITFAQSFAASPNTVFYVDGTSGTQAAVITVDEKDPAGNIITTNKGPVANYPTLTPSGDSAVASFSPTSVSSAPSSSTGGTAVTVNYVGTTAPPGGETAETVTVTANSGSTTTTTTTIPFVSLSAAFGGTGGQIGTNLYANAGQTVTIALTEKNAYDVGTSGANGDSFTSTTTCSGSNLFSTADDVSIPQTVPATTPFDGNSGNTTGHSAGPTSGSPNGLVTFTVTGGSSVVSNTPSCSLTIKSTVHNALAVTYTIQPNSGNLGITGSSLVRRSF